MFQARLFQNIDKYINVQHIYPFIYSLYCVMVTVYLLVTLISLEISVVYQKLGLNSLLNNKYV